MYQIYPKQITKIKHSPKESGCFVLMPFDEKYDEVYSEIKASLKKIGFDCIRADDIYENKPIMSTIVSEILSSHFIIADLSDKNPNVFYELGIAHSVRDIPNVVLISQSMEFVPFDIRHLPIVVYDQDNLKGLTSKLQKKILENKPYFEGHIRLRDRYHSRVGGEYELENLISFIDNSELGLWKCIRAMLSGETADISDPETVNTITNFRRNILILPSQGKNSLFDGLFLIYLDLIRFFSGLSEVKAHVEESLNNNKIAGTQLNATKEIGLIADIAISIYEQPSLKTKATEWFLNYLSKPKVAGIDLNRSKIESFIMICGDAEMHQSIIYLLQNRNELLRENAADFIGELQLFSAEKNLIYALGRENNPFVIRSIMSALGKLKSTEGAKGILESVVERIDVIKKQNLGYILFHAYNALELIDLENNTNFIKSFKNIVNNNDLNDIMRYP